MNDGILNKKNTLRVLLVLWIAVTIAMFYSFGVVEAFSKPAKVTGAKAKASKTTVVLTWKKAKKAQKYQVYRKVGSKYKKVTTVKKNAYTYRKGTPGTKYSFKVRGIRGKYKGQFSKVVSARLPKKEELLFVKWTATTGVELPNKKIASATYEKDYMDGTHFIVRQRSDVANAKMTAKTAEVLVKYLKDKYKITVKYSAKAENYDNVEAQLLKKKIQPVEYLASCVFEDKTTMNLAGQRIPVDTLTTEETGEEATPSQVAKTTKTLYTVNIDGGVTQTPAAWDKVLVGLEKKVFANKIQYNRKGGPSTFAGVLKSKKVMNCANYVCYAMQDMGWISSTSQFYLGGPRPAKGKKSPSIVNYQGSKKNKATVKKELTNPAMFEIEERVDETIANLVKQNRVHPGDIIGMQNEYHTMVFKGYINGKYYFYSFTSSTVKNKNISKKAEKPTYRVGVIIHPKKLERNQITTTATNAAVSDTTMVDTGKNVEIFVSAAPGMMIDKVYVDGVRVKNQDSYVFKKVNKNHTVKVVGKKIPEKK